MPEVRTSEHLVSYQTFAKHCKDKIKGSLVHDNYEGNPDTSEKYLIEN